MPGDFNLLEEGGEFFVILRTQISGIQLIIHGTRYPLGNDHISHQTGK